MSTIPIDEDTHQRDYVEPMREVVERLAAHLPADADVFTVSSTIAQAAVSALGQKFAVPGAGLRIAAGIGAGLAIHAYQAGGSRACDAVSVHLGQGMGEGERRSRELLTPKGPQQ